MYIVENSYSILPFQPQLPLPHPCSVIFYFVFWDDYSIPDIILYTFVYLSSFILFLFIYIESVRRSDLFVAPCF